jgi:hypothetical protein
LPEQLFVEAGCQLKIVRPKANASVHTIPSNIRSCGYRSSPSSVIKLSQEHQFCVVNKSYDHLA